MLVQKKVAWTVVSTVVMMVELMAIRMAGKLVVLSVASTAANLVVPRVANLDRLMVAKKVVR